MSPRDTGNVQHLEMTRGALLQMIDPEKPERGSLVQTKGVNLLSAAHKEKGKAERNIMESRMKETGNRCTNGSLNGIPGMRTIH